MKEKLREIGSRCREYLHQIFSKLLYLIRWIFIALTVGSVVGLFATMFAKAMNFVTEFRMENKWIILMMPLVGILIVALYKFAKSDNDRGTNRVISSISSEEDVPFRMAPLIFISTVLTHFVGGSAGREGAALQLGGSIGNSIGKAFHIDEKDKKIVIMSGMSAAFSALFGTPLAATIFSLEVVSVGIMHYSALLPCIISALVASAFAMDMGINPDRFVVKEIPEFSAITGGQIILLALGCAVISMLFCAVMHGTSGLLKRKIPNSYIRIVVVSVVLIGLGILLQTTDYYGAGIPVIEKAIAGEVIVLAFVIKIVFTALTLGGGFKGGEIVPSFFIGATFGCLIGQIIGLSPSLCAAIGMASVFCGVTNCPITSLLIGFELFGDEVKYYLILAVAISYMMSGYCGLYKDQRIMYSKSRTEYINTNAK